MAFPSLYQLVDAAERAELVVVMNEVEQTSYFLVLHPISHPGFVGLMNHHFLLIRWEVELMFGVAQHFVGLDTEAAVITMAEFHYVFHCLMNR